MHKKIDWKKIKEDYLICKDDITLKEFAKKHHVKYSTLRSRKNRESWDDVATDDATRKKRKANKEKIEYQKEIKKLKEADLTDKQRLFCIIYVKCFNATKAYQKAYDSGYNTAMVEGHRLLRNPKVKTEIDRLKQYKLNRAMLDEDDIFQKYIDIAFADITDFVEFGGKEKIVLNDLGLPVLDDEGKEIKYNINYVDFKDSESIDGTIISEVSKGKNGIKVKLEDKMKALQWLADRMDLLPTETQSKVEKTKAQTEKLKNISSDIEDTSELRRLLLDD